MAHPGIRYRQAMLLFIFGLSFFLFFLLPCQASLDRRPPEALPGGQGKAGYLDMDKDGFPDKAELIDEVDRVSFRRWFTAIAESQFYCIHSRWPKIRWDCTGLVCFAYKEALKKHDNKWLKGFKYLTDPGAPDIKAFLYPGIPFIQMNLFRTKPGTFKYHDLETHTFLPAVTAQVLMDFNCQYLGKELDETIMAGDLLFFSYNNQQDRVYHTMIVLKVYNGRSSGQADGIVVYHTGPDSSKAGEVRKVSISTLNRHPDDTWHVKLNNPYFLGFYRFNILDYQNRYSGGSSHD